MVIEGQPIAAVDAGVARGAPELDLGDLTRLYDCAGAADALRAAAS